MSDLVELGLSNYEARVYRTLLGLGSAPARTISEASEVPRGRIYDVLNVLNGRGLIRTHDSRDPTHYTAVDPDTAVDSLLDERRRELSERRRHYESVAESVSERLSPAIPKESRFWAASLGSEDALSLASDQQEIAEDRITSVVAAPYENAPWKRYASEIDVIEREMDPSLDVRVLCSEDLLSGVDAAVREDLLGLSANLAVRETPDVSITADVVDGHTVYVHVADPFDPSERLGVVAVRDETFADSMETAFESAWGDARRISGP
ncbi:TrmB family transcriptional regulator [Halorubrum halodurans]|uniref:Uncharacterized protein n=1 Tax=Halorubrum halodurans TaxID=1383851 RepID=A0A256IIP5_9EURY|nr:helix-turn-helix domain-containing protein [Halorubrum halodurans]OYR56042.1 hypothetical protein DJ70_10135 [Halorubrum halodurans]